MSKRMQKVLCVVFALLAAFIVLMGTTYASAQIAHGFRLSDDLADTPDPIVPVPQLLGVPEKEVPGARFAHSALELLAYGLGTLLLGLLGKLIVTVEKKFKVNVPDPLETYLTGLLDKGIHYAEEQAHKKVKATGKKLKMGESLDNAADFVLDLADKRQVKELGKEKLKKLIEARLNAKRSHGIKGGL